MKRLLLLAMAPLAMQAAAAPPPALMVLGVPHFDNPGRDIADVKVENVLTAARQREIEALVESLVRFHPNHVAIEWPASKQAKLDQLYADYRAGRYALTASEDEQIGFRVAARAGLARIDAVDWNEEPPGTDRDYDYDAWARSHGRANEFAALQAGIQASQDAYGARNRCRPIADWLREINGSAYLAADDRIYFRIASFGDAAVNPGAAWVGAWHARNLRITANLVRVAGQPGERTIAVFGAGHSTLLRSDAAGFGFTVVDPIGYLPPATAPHC